MTKKRVEVGTKSESREQKQTEEGRTGKGGREKVEEASWRGEADGTGGGMRG